MHDVVLPLGKDDDQVSLWLDQGMVMLKAVTLCGDPVEITSTMARRVAEAMLRLCDEEDDHDVRLLLHRGHVTKDGRAYDNPKAAVDHVHGFDQNGNEIRDPSDTTDDRLGEKHFPTTDPAP